jgi:AcrR family transcriptional regulator
LDSKREIILRTAWALIRQHGYAKTTIEDIAKSAGIGKGTVYLYFRSKVEIMLALVDLTNERITADLERIAEKKESVEERLRECLLHRVMTIYDLVHRYPHGEEVITFMKPEIVQRIENHVERQGRLLARMIREGNESGELDVHDPDGAGLLLAGLFEHLTPPYYRFGSRESLESFVNEVLEMTLRGMRKMPTGEVRLRAAEEKIRGTEAVERGKPGLERPSATSATLRDRELRCLNCFTRFVPEPGADRALCPQCRIEWRLSWLTPEAPKIRGPVWEKSSPEKC